jgi:hypothetical protein
MKFGRNANSFVLSMSVDIKVTCHNCQILSKLKFCENYLILSKLSSFSNILIFIDLLLPVSCNTSEKRELNSKKKKKKKKKKNILLQFLYVDKTDVTSICLESHFWTLITDYWLYSCFCKTYNLFQYNWNFILVPMYNEIRTKCQHFCPIDECWN